MKLNKAINEVGHLNSFKYKSDDLDFIKLIYDKYVMYITELTNSSIKGCVLDDNRPIYFELNGTSFKWDI